MTKVVRKVRGNSGYQTVNYVMPDGQIYDASVASSGTISAPGIPVVTPQGTTGATTYGYRIVARTTGTAPGTGQTTPGTGGTTATGNATLSVTNFNRVTWTAVSGASSYDVYGRTSGSELFMANVATPTFDDTGALTPSGALPGANTSFAYTIRVGSLAGASKNIVAPQRFNLTQTRVIW